MQAKWEIAFKGKKRNIDSLLDKFKILSDAGKHKWVLNAWRDYEELTPNYDTRPDESTVQMIFGAFGNVSGISEIAEEFFTIVPELEAAYRDDAGHTDESSDGHNYRYSKRGTTESVEVTHAGGALWFPKEMKFVKELFTLDYMLAAVFDEVDSIICNGKTFVFAGIFDKNGIKSKAYLQQLIENNGGKVANSISTKTNYVIIGNLRENAWGKYTQADEQRANGSDIKIISADCLLTKVEQTDNEPSAQTTLYSIKPTKKKSKDDSNDSSDDKKLWTIMSIDGSTCAITRYKGKEKDITIPAQIDSRRVISVSAFKMGGKSGFKDCERITIPEGVTQIGHWTFNRCIDLEEVILPHTLEDIGEQAFSYCTSLKKIIIPPSVINIGQGAFFLTMSTSIILQVQSGSYAERYVKENNINFEAI